MPALPTRIPRAACKAVPRNRLGAAGHRYAAPRNRLGRATLVSLAALLAAGLVAPAAPASPPSFKATSAAGDVAFFESDEKLVPGDTDGRQDVYERAFDPDVGEGGAYVTRELSTGPTGGNDAYNALFERASSDGTRVFFSTDESLVPEDADLNGDVYMRDRATGATVLVSQSSDPCAPACGNNPVDAGFAAVDGDGESVLFVTTERLVAADTDGAVDIYRRVLDAETTTRVSAPAPACAGSCGNGSGDAFLRGLSADGSTAFFTSAEALSEADTDSAVDVYARDLGEGVTVLVSRPDAGCGTCPNEGAAPVYRGSSDDGSRAFFTTAEKLAAGDEDEATDVYARDLPGGPTTLVSTGGTEDATASFAAVDAAGGNVFFTTNEALAGGDTNGANDVYLWSGGAPSLVSSGTCCGSTFNAAVGASTVFLTTTEQRVLGDTDGAADIYEQPVGGGAPALVSAGDEGCLPGCGNDGAAAIFNAVGAGGERAFFTTSGSLVEADEDVNADLYLRASGAATILASLPGFCPIPVKDGGCNVVFGGVSAAGDHAFFLTAERLSLEDNDSEPDVYEQELGAEPGEAETRLVSVVNSPDLELGPATPVLLETDPESPDPSTTPRVVGQSDAGTAIKLYREANCTGVVVATGTAAELTGAGIEVSVAKGATTKFWATATDVHGDTSACSNALSYTQEESPPSGGGPGNDDDDDGSDGGGGAAPAPSASGPAPAPPPPLTHSGGVPYVVPFSRITYGPAFKTRRRRPAFRFTDATGQPGTRFICRVDRRRWRRCGSPLRLRGLGRGRHVLRVKARNAAGVWEPRLSKRRFKMVRGDGKRRKGRRAGRRGRR
jgi:hypothetical protein